MLRTRTPSEKKERDERKAEIREIKGLPPKAKPKRTKPKKSAKARENDRLDALDKAAVIERDGPQCAICGRLGGDLHHIFLKGARHMELRHVAINHLILCRSCHDDAHADEPGFFEWLKAARPEQHEALDADNRRACGRFLK